MVKTETLVSGDTMWVKVSSRAKNRVEEYKPFPIYVSHDQIDPYIVYRLIEPGYESWRNITINARELSSFEEMTILHNSSVGQGCVNCHNFSSGSPDRMMLHVRGVGGGTLLVDGDAVRILNLAATGPRKQGAYPAWHPCGRYIAFSSNSTNQEFTIDSYPPIEVYDTASDIIVLDTQTDSVITYAPLNTAETLETFPCWSSDGNVLYYCAADLNGQQADGRPKLSYRIMSVAFEGGNFVGEPQLVYEADGVSCSFPRVSGDWLMFTAADYGTFPIWHREADLRVLNLTTGEYRAADELNSPDTESYHSWSSNGKWVVFSSRRIDGRYTRLYIAHHNGDGTFGKPFLLPQKDAKDNTLRLKSYNVPEFVRERPRELDESVGGLF